MDITFNEYKKELKLRINQKNLGFDLHDYKTSFLCVNNYKSKDLQPIFELMKFIFTSDSKLKSLNNIYIVKKFWNDFDYIITIKSKKDNNIYCIKTNKNLTVVNHIFINNGRIRLDQYLNLLNDLFETNEDFFELYK